MEMYFMKSGECRVVMEVRNEPKNAPRPIPQAALKSCRLPSISKASHTGHGFQPFVAKQGFDLRYQAERPYQEHMNTLQPKYARSFSRHDSFCSLGRPSPQLSEYYSSSDDIGGLAAYVPQDERRNWHGSSCLSFASMGTASELEARDSVKGPRSSQRQTLQGFQTMKNANSYTLTSFLREFEQRDSRRDHIPDLGFSDAQALSWNTGTNLPGMLRGDISDATVYQVKFEKWASRVLARERKVRAEAAIDHEFVTNVPKGLMWNSWPPTTQKPVVCEDTVFLDVGALHAGDFFGEIGLLHHMERKASILTVTSVEVLVLSKWDFNRQVDRDIVDCLSANGYKKIEYVFQEYRKTCRWALYKKKLMHEVLAARRQRFPNLYEHDICRGMGCTRYAKKSEIL